MRPSTSSFRGVRGTSPESRDSRFDASHRPGMTVLSALRATLHRLANLEPLELRVAEIERLVVAGPGMRGPKRVRPRPRFEGSVVRPDRVRGIERMVLRLRTPQQMKLDEARHLVEIGVARRPDMLEILLGARGDAKTTQGDKPPSVS